MSRKKREKGYWEKRTETFKTGSAAKERAGLLRTHEKTAISHVTMDKKENPNDQYAAQYVVAYSVAKWYLADLKRSGVKL